MISNFSLLIPVYNFNVVPLVEQLHKLAIRTKLPFEILLVDDGSTNHFKKINKQALHFDEVEYIEQPVNLGRAKIRNFLFQKAKYDYCIILDCDVLLAKEIFLERYFEYLTDTNVVVGGHVYLARPPKDKSKYLHWLYGHKQEVSPLENRLAKPYASFMTNCFAISKKLFLSLGFDESILDYGHEDTLFGLLLKEKQVTIEHIKNPVVHLGIDTEAIFYQKQEKAIKNLVQLSQTSKYKKALYEDIKLLRFYDLFYTKFPYRALVKATAFVVKLLPFKMFKLSRLNIWKLEKLDFYMEQSKF